MPVRLAHRLSDFLELPFVIVCNARFHEAGGHRWGNGAGFKEQDLAMAVLSQQT